MGIGGDLGGGIGGAIGGIAVLAGAAGKGGEKYLKQALKVWEKLKASNFDYTQLTPPELKVFAEYMPEQYTAVVPESVRLAQDSVEGRQAQLGGIHYLEGVRDQGIPLGTKLHLDQAARGIQDEAQRTQGAITQGLAARGRLGGGSEIQARIGGNQQAMELANSLGGNLLENEIMARMQAAQGAAGLGSQLRGQDIGLAQANADYINRFNAMTAGARTQQNMANAQSRQMASNQNVANRQNVGEQNAMNRYNVALQNLNRKNSLLGQNFDQNYRIAQGQASALAGLGNAAYAEQAARANSIMSLGKGVGQAGGGALDFGGFF